MRLNETKIVSTADRDGVDEEKAIFSVCFPSIEGRRRHLVLGTSLQPTTDDQIPLSKMMGYLICDKLVASRELHLAQYGGWWTGPFAPFHTPYYGLPQDNR
jgi:hypothetical protein